MFNEQKFWWFCSYWNWNVQENSNSNVNLNNYSFELTPKESTAGETMLHISSRLSYKPWIDLKGTLICQYLRLCMEKYVEDFSLKHFLLFEISTREVCEKFVYKNSETIDYVKK